MQSFNLPLSIVTFLFFFSSYHSHEINRLQARSLAAHTPQIASSTSKSGEAFDKTQELARLGNPDIDPQISGNPLDNKDILPSHSEKGPTVHGPNELLRIEHPNPSAAADAPITPQPKDSTLKSKFIGFFQKLKALGQRFVNFWKDVKFMHRAMFKKPLPDSEIVKFENSRNMIGKYLTLGGHNLEIAPGEPFNIKNLAKTLDEKFPLLLSFKGRAQTEIFYEPYLKYLKQYQLILDENAVARKSWMSELQTVTVADHDQTIADLSNSLKELQQPIIMKHFKPELDHIVNTIFDSTGGSLQKQQIEEHFLKFFAKGDSKSLIDLDKLASAREVQLTKKLPTDARVLDLEHVFQNLPPDQDPKEVVFRYAMIEGFEDILKESRPDFSKELHTQVQTGIADVLKASSHQKSEEVSIFRIAAREDEEWLENAFMKFYATTVGPREVFDSLKRLPKDKEIIRYAMKKHINSLDFLEKGQLEVLRQARTRESFMDQVKLFGKDIKNHNGPDASKKLEALENLRKDAGKSYQFNLPLAQELTDKGIINERLILSAEGSKKKFSENLGTPEDFKKLLMNKFETDLDTHLKQLPEKTQGRISLDVASWVADSQMNQINQEAKSQYLTTDSFQKPNSFKFDQALQAYNGKFMEFSKNPTDPHTLARAYMDSVFSHEPFKNAPVSSVSGKAISESLDLKIRNIENLLYQHFPEMGKYFEDILKPKGYFASPNNPPRYNELMVGQVPMFID